jgi:DNA-binding CsgD family transcriptional regulator
LVGARPRREALSGVESLTPREYRIAELASQGLGNREIAQALFITRKTVEAHMRNIFGVPHGTTSAANPSSR